MIRNVTSAVVIRNVTSAVGNALVTPFLISDGVAVGMIALGLAATIMGQPLTPGTMFAVGAGFLAVSVGWRLFAWGQTRGKHQP